MECENCPFWDKCKTKQKVETPIKTIGCFGDLLEEGVKLFTGGETNG